MATVVMDKWATQKMFAPEFDATATYAVGAWVCYGGKAWQCHTAVSTAGDWTGATNWTEKPLAEMLGDIKSTVDALAAKYCDIVVTCVTQDNVTVTGQTVTLRAGSSAEAEIYDTRAYNGQPVTFQVPQGFRYFVEVSANLQGHFAPTTATGTATTSTTAVTLTYSDITRISTYADIKNAMDNITSQAEGRAALLGIEIADTWVRDDDAYTWSDPMIVADVQPVKDPEGNEHLAAIMMRKYATYRDIQFDAPENGIEAYATESTAQGGIFYWGYGKDYAQATTYAVNAYCGYKGGVWKCTTAVTGAEAFDPTKWSLLDAKFYDATSTYAIGDYCKRGSTIYECAVAIDTAEEWDVSHWAQIKSSWWQSGALVYISLSAGASVPYANWAVVYKTNISSSNKDYFGNGYNNWELSAWRQYLNSADGIGLWWHTAHTGDCPPSQLSTSRGYKAGCSSALLQYAKPIMVPFYPWSGLPSYTIDTFWLLSCTEQYGNVNLYEGGAIKRVQDNCNTISGWTSPNNGDTNARKYYRVSATGTAVTNCTRSSSRVASYYVWTVSKSGALSGNGNADTSVAGVPACAIY